MFVPDFSGPEFTWILKREPGRYIFNSLPGFMFRWAVIPFWLSFQLSQAILNNPKRTRNSRIQVQEYILTVIISIIGFPIMGPMVITCSFGGVLAWSDTNSN